MKILYDFPGFEREVSGAARYYLEVIKFLNPNNEIILASKYVNNIAAGNYFQQKNKFLEGFNFKGKGKIENFLQKQFSRNVISKKGFDILHSTGQDFYFKHNVGDKPFVVTVMDLIYELFFCGGVVSDAKVEYYERANRIITISNHTKFDLLKLYPFLDERKISVIHLGVSAIDKPIIQPKIKGQYILYVGTRKEEYKNFVNFISSIKPILEKGKEISVVCTGEKFTDDELFLFKKLQIENKVVNTGFVSDEELYGLYSNALLFVFPSYYEGFGIPILEAFKCNCPAAISNTSCFPEIAGDAVSYFDPHDQESILESVSKIIYDTDYANSLRKKGTERLLSYSWESTAKQTEVVYRSLL